MISKFIYVFSFHFDVIDTRILSGRMVSKNANPLHLLLFASYFLNDLANCSIVVEPAQASNVPRVDSVRIKIEDIGVSISRICHYNTLDIFFSH